jgi:hypothetical protein
VEEEAKNEIKIKNRFTIIPGMIAEQMIQTVAMARRR